MLMDLALSIIIFASLLASTSAWNAYNYGTDWNDAFPLCGSGKQQSPIALSQITPGPNLLPFNFTSWGAAGSFTVSEKHGETIQVDTFNVQPTLKDPNSGVLYNLAQFHFHTPSEHVWGSGLMDMEVHLVHVRAGGNSSIGTDLLVVGIGFVASDVGVNRFLNNFWTKLASAVAANENGVQLNTQLDFPSDLPESRAYLSYKGSLTTPPCTEGVSWYVMEEPVSLSRAQLAYIRNATNLTAMSDNSAFVPAGNRRNPQPLNGRVVLRFSDLPTLTSTPAPPAAPQNMTIISNLITYSESSLTGIFTFLNSVALIIVIYTLRNQIEIPFYGKLMPQTKSNSRVAAPNEQSTSSTSVHNATELREENISGESPPVVTVKS